MSSYAKAIAAAVVTVLGTAAIALQSALTDGNVSAQEWVTILIAALAALGATAGVYAKANAVPLPPPGG